MNPLHDTSRTCSASNLITRIGLRALYAGVATAVLGLSVNSASSAEPFQMFDSDLTSGQSAPDTTPRPFRMLTSDVQTAGRTTIYQGNQSAGDAEITNNTGEAVVFNDESTASSANIINNTGGATQFNNQSTAASAFITNNADASLTFNDNSEAADSRITNNGKGNLVFNDHATAGSAVITNNGTTHFSGNSTADNALITNNATGSIQFHDDSDAGRRQIDNNGQISFADRSSANSSLINNNKTGNIVFSDDSTGANGNIKNGGRLRFADNSSADHLDIVNNETGSVSFNGHATAANATIANSGSMAFADDSTAKDARIVNNADAGIRFQDRADAGSSMIVNAGDLTFSGKSSAGQSTILTSVGGTTRFQDQADGGSAIVQIDQNATLDASGLSEHRLSLGALTSAGDVNLGKTVLTVQGSAVLNETSKIDLVLGYGKLIADDVELQGGTLELHRAADLLYALGQTYKIIDAQTLSGSNFAEEVTHDFAFVTPLLSADGTAITLERNQVRFEDVAQSRNQTAVANAIDALATDRLIYRAIISSSTTDATKQFDQLSGEIHATAESAIHDKSVVLRTALLERARRSTDADRVPGDPPRADVWQSWLTTTGTITNRDGDGNAAASRLSGYAVNGGIDRAITDTLSLGLAGNFEQNTLKISDRGSSADINTFGAGVYGAWQSEGFGIRSGASYQHHAIDVERNIVLPSLNGSLQNDYKAWTAQVFAEAGYRFDVAGLQIESFGGLSYVKSSFDGFQETGLTDAALKGASASLDSTIGTLGIRLDRRFRLDDEWRLDAQFEAAWNRAFSDQAVIRQVSFSSGMPFSTVGLSSDQNNVALNARMSLSRSDRFSVNIIYSGLLSDHGKSHTFGAGTVMRF